MSIKEAIEKMGISRSSWYKYCRGWIIHKTMV
jgi:ACT domain-containing protein